jgi:hypothetical protein
MELIQHTMFTFNLLAHFSTEELFEAVLKHGKVVCSAGTTTRTEMYRILRSKVERSRKEMCRVVCELYRRNILPKKNYDLRQIIDLTPKCDSCHKDVPLEGFCQYHQDTYAQPYVRCKLCAPEHYQPLDLQTYDAAIAWRFYEMINATEVMLEEIKNELDLLHLVKRTMDHDGVEN